MIPNTADRRDLIRRGRHLEYFTVGWNTVEALVSILSGMFAGSVALVGFGLDSVIEVVSGAALLWRLQHDLDPPRREQAERTTLRIVSWCFMALAAYIIYESTAALILREAPASSIPGILIAAASVVVMPILSRAKRRVAAGLASAAMHADSRQTDFCAYLSAILLGGLLLNALVGLWWADPLAGLVMAPIVAKEGIDGLKGKTCCANCSSR